MRILNAAAHVLSRKGYAGTRLSDVADQAQLQAPAIYYYFPSREALVEEVMWTGIWLMREHVGQVLAALPPGTGPMERIDAAVAAHLRYALDISDYTTAAIRNAGQVPDDIRIRYSAEAAKYGEIWHALLHDAAKASLLRPELEPMAARMLVLGALNWAAEWWDPGRRTSLDTVVRTAQSLVRNGLSASDGNYRPAPEATGQRRETEAGGGPQLRVRWGALTRWPSGAGPDPPGRSRRVGAAQRSFPEPQAICSSPARRAAMPRAVWLLTAPWLIPIALAICASDRSA